MQLGMIRQPRYRGDLLSDLHVNCKSVIDFALVEQMLAARKQLAGAQSDKDKDFYTHRCDGLDRQIDALVYDLYALTPAEIRIVESASAEAPTRQGSADF